MTFNQGVAGSSPAWLIVVSSGKPGLFFIITENNMEVDRLAKVWYNVREGKVNIASSKGKQMIVEGIRKISKDIIQKAIVIGLIALIFVLPIPQFIMPIYFTKAILIQTTLLRLFLIYFSFLFAIELINKRVHFCGNKWVWISLLGLAVIGFVSVVRADDWILALYGLNKGEGYFSLLAYYMIFLMTTLLEEKRYLQILWKAFLLFGVLISLVGIVQFTGFYRFGFLYPGMAYVPMRNPNFYGAFAVLFTGAAIGGFFLYRKDSAVTHPVSRWNRSVWYGLVLLGYAACISAASSLVYAGLIMMLLLYLFLEIGSGRKQILPFFGLIVGFVVVMILFDILSGGAVIGELFSVGYQIQEEGTIFGDHVGSSRMLIWKQTVALLPEYGWFGCGLEQLGMLCLDTYGIENGIQFDKAHNEYLNLWITEGIFALVFYLIFLFALFIPGLKQFFGGEKKKARLSKIAFFAFFGYIAQAFFNISVVQVAPYFWMICGLLCRGLLSKGKA